MVLCHFCNNNFSNDISLYNHQRKAKYCIDIQKLNNIEIKSKEFECKWCEKKFIVKRNLIRHEESCKNKDDELNTLKSDYDKEINKYKEKCIDLEKKIIMLETRLEDKEEISNKFESLHKKREECIEKIALQPKMNNIQNTSTTQNNQIINNLPIFNITVKQLEEAAEEGFSRELFLQGQIGAAKFTLDFIRKVYDNSIPWVVSDRARGIFKLKGEDGRIFTDSHAEYISGIVAEALKKKNKEHHDSFYPKRCHDVEDNRDESEIDREGQIELEEQTRADNCFMDIAKLKRDNTVFRKKLIKETKR